eukprot:GILJ01005936.1.p1 GENE.GILJ01005936.1~~GILJ01005936.1.p1  ORF type:complete len:552 (-),score=24.00 GILJ01005936.1:90-1745(-)
MIGVHQSRRRNSSRVMHLLRYFTEWKAILGLFFCVTICLVSWPYRPHMDATSFDDTPSHAQAYSDAMHWQSRSSFTAEDVPGVTAVMLSWKRIKNLQNQASLLLAKPYIRELIIWNNNGDVTLHPKEISVNHEARVKIINSPSNIFCLGRFYACRDSNYEICYFQDDDWFNPYMDSMLHSYLARPNLVHSLTMDIIYWEQRRWAAYNRAVHMYGGFTWLGVGSYVSKSLVERFLKQIVSSSMVGDDLLVSDMFFSLWTNTFPVQLEAALVPFRQSEGWSNKPKQCLGRPDESSCDQWTIVTETIAKAGRMLNSSLTQKHPHFLPNADSESDFLERHTRAPCANDLCLFESSDYPFPLPSEIPFQAVASIKEQEEAYNMVGMPQGWAAYHFAVDGHPDTCWVSAHRNHNQTEYFGLDFVRPLLLGNIHILMHASASSSALASVSVNELLPLHVQVNSEKWTIAPSSSFHISYLPKIGSELIVCPDDTCVTRQHASRKWNLVTCSLKNKCQTLGSPGNGKRQNHEYVRKILIMSTRPSVYLSVCYFDVGAFET